MNLNQLYYFNELVKQHQFSSAAKRLHISQPSLSNSIKTLEKELNCNLIERRNGRVELTKYGQIFLESADSIILTLENAKHNINHTKQIENNTIEIGYIPTARENFLPHITSVFEKENSSTFHYIYHNGTSNQICLEVQNGNFDLGICSKIDTYSDLNFIPLYVENTFFTASKLASKLDLPQSTRTIYLVYSTKHELSVSVQN
ncbi:LysR family transcriptional regulator [Lactobacillus helveticus]|uniref:Transcriptional regulator n=1 Tax=Lactobacillus helveticus CIRM-BIA 104 TaxID=1226333 RepID=U6FB42_LACHE|nr:LysR family transcriptional regulator [Lactobacillus helveticus]AGQ22697.1 transcription regulator [Lactobacillus helveticus CNRZ32]AUJ28445.1 transcriptional regulator [Lactobacillus helveticus]KXN78114.1 transcriptional regulator [Lactobacillus helveticus]KXN80458.1 transcriptional regulator [Lactobacillus helveticus]MBW8000019.1 LysR family transcriptional regulator [Lactobacillus helveticus]